MGLDLYVGTLTRYHCGTWLTVVQQMGQQLGMNVEVVRANPEPDDRITDPAVVGNAVRQWQAGLGQALGCSTDWPEGGDLPYWTDKPDWDGYGGVMLLAAYDERPDLDPARASGRWRKAKPDAPRRFDEARAYREASQQPRRYPSLLSGVQWWLPLPDGPGVFTASTPTGQQVRMGRVDHLLTELRALTDRLELFAATDRQAVLQAGPPTGDASAQEAGRFGVAVMLNLAERAHENQQPLLMDY